MIVELKILFWIIFNHPSIKLSNFHTSFAEKMKFHKSSERSQKKICKLEPFLSYLM